MNNSILIRIIVTAVLAVAIVADNAAAQTYDFVGPLPPTFTVKHASQNRPDVVFDSVAKGNTSQTSGSQAGHGHSPTRPAKDELLFRLSGYEYFPTRQDLDTIANPAYMEQLLIDIVKNDTSSIHRIRAVDALGYYDSQQVIDFLDKLAHGPNSPTGAALNIPDNLAVSLQHRGITALARSAKAQAVPYLEDLLASDDIQIQLTVIDALGKNAGVVGRKVIEAFVQTHPDPMIAHESEKFLQ